MKHFAIGDGHKRVTLPDRYQTEITHDGTAIFWDPSMEDIPIRVSSLTIEPKDESETEAGFWAVINKANQSESEPTVFEDKSIYEYRTQEDEGGEVFRFYEVGMANSLVIFSITASDEDEKSDDFTQVKADVDEMIKSLLQRAEDQSFTCQLPCSDFDEINETIEELMPDGISDKCWHPLQLIYDKSLEDKDLETAAKVGVIFGELMKQDIPAFAWFLTIDDWGCARSLNFGDSGISVFPENMIVKRAENQEPIDLKQFASDTIDAVEQVFREEES